MRIFCRTVGRGTPLLLLHGYLESQRCWEPVLESLWDHFSLIAVDLPGYGESDRPKVYGYSIESFTHTVANLLDSLGLARVSLMGHAMGATVGLNLAASYPERVDRVVAVDPVVFPFSLPIEGKLALLPVVGEILFKHLYSRWDLQRFLRKEVYLDPRLPSEGALQFYWERLNRPGGREAAYRTLQSLSHLEHLETMPSSVECPVMLVWGERDRIVPVEHGRRLAAALRRGQLVTIPGAGHAPQEERPQAFCATVLPFLHAP